MNQQDLVQSAQAALELLNSNQTEQALSAFEQLVNSNPEIHELKFGKAVALARLGDMQTAIHELGILLEKVPNHSAASELRDALMQDASPQAHDLETTVRSLLEQATILLQNNQTDQAFALIVEAKKSGLKVAGADYVRALYFLKKERSGDAKQSLLEELRFFPENEQAQQLLNHLLSLEQHLSARQPASNDQEFLELLEKIRPYSMLPEQRLAKLFELAKHVCVTNIPGNFVECGVAGGGSSAMLAAVIKRYSTQPRKLFACDTFEGMPEPSEHDTNYGVAAEETGWGTGTCAAPSSSLQEISDKLGVSDIIVPVKGLFQDTLPEWNKRMAELALIHLDSDWYESTKCILDNLYDQVVKGGILQLDDFDYWDGIKKAVGEFQQERALSLSLQPIDGMSVWFIKP